MYGFSVVTKIYDVKGYWNVLAQLVLDAMP